jgi:hypothetical protein
MLAKLIVSLMPPYGKVRGLTKREEKECAPSDYSDQR